MDAELNEIDLLNDRWDRLVANNGQPRPAILNRLFAADLETPSVDEQFSAGLKLHLLNTIEGASSTSILAAAPRTEVNRRRAVYASAHRAAIYAALLLLIVSGALVLVLWQQGRPGGNELATAKVKPVHVT